MTINAARTLAWTRSLAATGEPAMLDDLQGRRPGHAHRCGPVGGLVAGPGARELQAATIATQER